MFFLLDKYGTRLKLDHKEADRLLYLNLKSACRIENPNQFNCFSHHNTAFIANIFSLQNYFKIFENSNYLFTISCNGEQKNDLHVQFWKDRRKFNDMNFISKNILWWKSLLINKQSRNNKLTRRKTVWKNRKYFLSILVVLPSKYWSASLTRWILYSKERILSNNLDIFRHLLLSIQSL